MQQRIFSDGSGAIIRLTQFIDPPWAKDPEEFTDCITFDDETDAYLVTIYGHESGNFQIKDGVLLYKGAEWPWHVFEARSQRIKEVEARTKELIEGTFTYQDLKFDLTRQNDWNGILMGVMTNTLPLPLEVTSVDHRSLPIAELKGIQGLCQAMFLRKKYIYDEAAKLVDSLRQADNKKTIDSIKDERV